MHRQLADGRLMRLVSIVDGVASERLRAVADTSTSGRRAVRELADPIAERVSPKLL